MTFYKLDQENEFALLQNQFDGDYLSALHTSSTTLCPDMTGWNQKYPIVLWLTQSQIVLHALFCVFWKLAMDFMVFSEFKQGIFSFVLWKTNMFHMETQTQHIRVF